MFDIELFTFAKVNFTRSTEKASQTLFKHAKNGGKGQETQLDYKAATRTGPSVRRVYLGRLQHYS